MSALKATWALIAMAAAASSHTPANAIERLLVTDQKQQQALYDSLSLEEQIEIGIWVPLRTEPPELYWRHVTARLGQRAVELLAQRFEKDPNVEARLAALEILSIMSAKYFDLRVDIYLLKRLDKGAKRLAAGETRDRAKRLIASIREGRFPL